VDGFELGVPSLRRDSLGIPTDAVVYLTAQDGRKRHPEMMRLQIKILQEVPNSYLLIKGLGDLSVQDAFGQVAEEEGVGRDRLHFLSANKYESTHRANLGIADVVLDTYPYNGATTTLETLWVGIPIVTRVGQQWAARNRRGVFGMGCAFRQRCGTAAKHSDASLAVSPNFALVEYQAVCP
jgi:predicted O-linked N-acetylglucosamine transferase (SPINDLY family)